MRGQEISRKARKGSKSLPWAKSKGRKEDFYVEKRMDAYIPPLYQEGAGVCGIVKLSNGSLNEGGRLFVKQATSPFIPPQGGIKM